MAHCRDNPAAVDMKASIDGLLAAVSFSDKVDSYSKLQKDSSVPASRLVYSNLPGQQNQPPVNARLFEGPEYTFGKSRQTGWGLLHGFKQKTDEFHAKLREHLDSHNCNFILRWLESYESPAKLRQYGLLVLRDIYCDKPPSCTSDCFAAMIVQHSIRDISLCGTGRSGSAVFGWKESLLMPSDIEELGCLYEQLSLHDHSNLGAPQGIVQGPNSVPASQEYLQVGGQFNSEPQAEDPGGMSLDYYGPYPSLQPPQTNMSSLASPGLGVGWFQSQNPGYGFQQDTGQPSFGFADDGMRPIQYTSNYIQPPPFSPAFSLSFPPNAASEYPAPISPVQQIDPSSIASPMSPSDHQQQPYPSLHSIRSGNIALVLKESPPFLIFIKFVEDFGTVLDLFSTKSMVPSPAYSYGQPTSSFALRRHSEFIRDIQLFLLAPLSSPLLPFAEDPVINGIIAAADLMVSVGNLQCLRRVEDYLILLGKTFITKPQPLKQFATAMLKDCLAIAGKPGYRKFCYSEADVDKDSQYSQKYVTARLNSLSTREHQSSNTLGEYMESDSLSAYSKSRTFDDPSRDPSVSFQSESQGTTGSVVFASEYDVMSQTNSMAHSHEPEYAPKRCDKCPKVFTGRWAPTSLSRHQRADHTDHVYKCPYCPKTDKRSCNLSKHIEKMHPAREIPKFGQKGIARLPHHYLAAV